MLSSGREAKHSGRCATAGAVDDAADSAAVDAAGASGDAALDVADGVTGAKVETVVGS